MLSQSFVWVALLIAVFGNFFYFRDTLKGETKPNRVTFFLWGVAPLIAFFAQHNAGGGEQAFYTLVIALMPLAIFGASFVDRKAYWKITPFDIACGCISLVALGLLLLTNQPLLSLLFSVVADLSAAIPTIIKSYKYPETETTLAYAFEIGSSLVVLLTIHNWIFVDYFFAAYVLCTNAMFTLILIFSPNRA
jgi:hypothetical protein